MKFGSLLSLKTRGKRVSPRALRKSSNPSIRRSSKNQLFDSHNDHYSDTPEPLNTQQILYNKGSLKNVHLEEAKELGVCTGQVSGRGRAQLQQNDKKLFAEAANLGAEGRFLTCASSQFTFSLQK